MTTSDFRVMTKMYLQINVHINKHKKVKVSVDVFSIALQNGNNKK